VKIDVMSDVHLEFGFYEPVNENGADVLVLAGDICVLDQLGKESYTSIKEFFEMASHNYDDVIYVMGNHEHYHGDIKNATTIFKEKFHILKNIHLLDNSSIAIGDTTFIGGTLWTNFNNDSYAMKTIARMMNDYRCIDYDGKLFTASKSVELHYNTMEYFNKTVPAFHKVVMVTHHSPSFKNLSERFSQGQSCSFNDNNIRNMAYHSNLNYFILGHPQIKAWISGHTHDPFDHYLGDTRLVCNPRGYLGYEDTAINYKPKTIEV